MYNNIFPTKSNLIACKNTLKLSIQGYKLLDKKRNVLIKEIISLNKKAYEIQNKIDTVFKEAYSCLKKANIEMGSFNVENFSRSASKEQTISIKTRSIMGVEIHIINCNNCVSKKPVFGFKNTTITLDEVYEKFNKVKDLIIELSMLEDTAYRLSININKTQKRANALKNITIPKYEIITKEISDILEERDRDEFIRLKTVKKLTR